MDLIFGFFSTLSVACLEIWPLHASDDTWASLYVIAFDSPVFSVYYLSPPSTYAKRKN